MNSRFFFILSFFCFSFSLCCSAQALFTHPVDEKIKTLRTVVDGDFQRLPVIDNSDNSLLEISFDYLSNEEPFLAYRIVHCDADWQEDDLSELDFLDGFMPVKVVDVRPSFNTFSNYFHYSVAFPNEDVKLLVSGNYAVIFHDESEPDEPLAVATFSVSEQMAFVAGEVSGNTDIDFRQDHQQLTLQCTWSQQQLPYLNPASDLKLMVTQNHRRDTRREVKAPSRMEAGKAYYEHLKPLIFEAGNTYRRFEFTDARYATFGVEHVEYHASDYHVMLTPSQARSGGFYRFDQDQHGRYLIHALRVDDVDTESDYFYALFTLEGAMPPKGSGGIYLSGDFTYGETTDVYRMKYDLDAQCYTATVRLKQGHYNYQYLVKMSDDSLTASVVEGNYYETKNQYEVFVYYRPMGARYDRLLGVGTIGDKK